MNQHIPQIVRICGRNARKSVQDEEHTQPAIDGVCVYSYIDPIPAENKIIDPVASAAKAAMAERGISARKLAQRLAMRPETVLDFVLQRRETRPSTRLSICRELGVNREQTQATA